MKHFLTPTNELHAFDDDIDPELLQKFIEERSLTPATPEQVQAIQNPAPTPEQLAAQARAQRDAKLAALDALCVPLRWEGYTPEHRDALRVYRQDLLDVPQQAGFPAAIDWPELPTPSP